ncbi:MAG: PIN domain-containing protein [Blastocatellia bacterium]|nr:PIN domain-containing protein [Blastocatellia bacterium]
MAKYVLDTNIVQRRAFDPDNLPTQTYASTVVLFELMTACNDVKELKAYQQAWKQATESDLLLSPTETDWLDASRISYLLAQERKQQAGGKSPKRTAMAKQEIAMDCLLAISAYREGVTIITNDKDFRAIKRYRKGLKLQRYPF